MAFAAVSGEAHDDDPARLDARDDAVAKLGVDDVLADVVQLREKHANDGDIVRAGRVFRRLCDAYDALFIVNDRPEVAMACAADGVHVGQDDAPPAEVRRMVGEDALIGLSTHSPAAGGRGFWSRLLLRGPGVRDAHEAGLRAGRPRPRSVCLRAGDCAVASLSEASTPATSGEVVHAGAERVVVVRAIRDAADPGAAARALRQGIDAALSAGARG